MAQIASFKPIEPESARTLVLGSMPGTMSLAAKQYYAHPRNAFWKIMSAILEFPETAAYEERVAALKNAGIALWDVLQYCVRDGSLDADIEAGSEKANNIQSLLQRLPGIKVVCFNGTAAESCFKRLVMPTLKNVDPKYVRLPSTSPAHAALSFEQKVAVWRAAICV
jgi:double-stranded uracil-DNA glycosylase